MGKNIDIKEILFSDPRLEFSNFARFFWQLVHVSFYAILGIATVTALFSQIDWLTWLGVLSALFLAMRLINIGKAPQSILELNANELKGINAADYLTPKAFHFIEKTFDKALALGGNFYLRAIKMLMADRGIRGALWRLEISPEEFEQKVDEEIALSKEQEGQKEIFEKASVLTKLAFLNAYLNRQKYIQPSDLFAAFSFVNDEAVKKLIYIFSLNEDDLEKALIFSHFRRRFSLPFISSLGEFGSKKFGIRHRIMNRAWTARPTPNLDRFSYDLTDLAREREVGLLIGHQKEYDALINILSKPTRPNALLIGEPGSGKESILDHLALNIVKDNVPEALFDKRVVCFQISNLIAGANPQEISDRINKIGQEVIGAENIILYMPDIHNLARTSGDGNMDAADILLPIITKNEAQAVGATFPKEFKQFLEPRSDFKNAFETINVEEVSEDEAMKILTYEGIILEHQYKIVISFQAIKQAVVLAHKYFHQKLLPSGAEDLLKEALAEATQRGDKVLKAEHIIGVCERKVNVPIHKAGKEEAEMLLNLESAIHRDMIDQDEAVGAVSKALREYRSGLNRQGGPIATFLFVGPTGVGKTELAKILAKTQFGSENMMARFDMSEYQDKQSVFRFIGSPDGKISGALTETVVQKPYCLILLDEFEKANSDVLNIFLQVFDDGRLTDNLGRVVDFKNTIIIATSNANSEFIKEQLEGEKKIDDFKDEFKKKLTEYFKPELLNRFSDIIIFKNLSREDTLQIAKIQLKKLAQIASESQGIKLQFGEDAVSYIARKGFDPVFGARPLRNVISQEIKSLLAEKFLKEEIIKGNTVKVETKDGEIEMNIS